MTFAGDILGFRFQIRQRPLQPPDLQRLTWHVASACGRSTCSWCAAPARRLRTLLDPPLVYGDVLTDGFVSNERAASALRLGQTVKAFPQLRLQPQRHYPVFRHEYPPNTKEHCVF